MPKAAEVYTKREVFTAINNALAAANNSPAGPVPEKRLARLRKVAEALTEDVAKNLVEQELIRSEEAVIILLSAALAVQHGLSGHRSEQLETVTRIFPK